MMQDLDGSFDAAMMVGYHSAAASGGNPLAHTFSGKVFRLTINQERASEFLCNTYSAYLHKVPVVYLSGDKALCAEVSAFNASITTTAVTEGIGASTLSLQPGVAVAAIKRDVKAALSQNIQGFKCDLPDNFQVELIFKVHADAYKASYYPGATRINATTVSFASKDYLAVLTFLLFVL
jgi:D-amino peptidase